MGLKDDEVLQEMQPIVSGAEVPIENREVDGMLIREPQRADSASEATRIEQPSPASHSRNV